MIAAPTAPATAKAENAKAVATLQARAAIAGISLYQVDGGRFLATRWNLVRELADIDSAERWLATVTGAAR